MSYDWDMFFYKFSVILRCCHVIFPIFTIKYPNFYKKRHKRFFHDIMRQELILDEPMNGLDKEGINLVKKILKELSDKGKTKLLSSHYAEDVDICDVIYEMDCGELKEFKR